jgi:DNA-binding transcriptional MerR regulator
MKIGDLARASGLSIDTLRYYEKIGLLPRARRAGGQRIYGEDILTWIDFLKRLKATGMPIAEMITYARLREAGPETSALRRQMMEAHRASVAARIAELDANLAVLDGKIETYRAIEAELATSAASGQPESSSHDRTDLPRPDQRARQGPRSPDDPQSRPRSRVGGRL